MLCIFKGTSLKKLFAHSCTSWGRYSIVHALKRHGQCRVLSSPDWKFWAIHSECLGQDHEWLGMPFWKKKNFFFQKVFEESSGVLRSAFRKNTLTARHKIEWTESRYREDVLWFGHLIAWKKNCTLVGNVCSCKKLRIEREAIEYERYFLRLTIWRKSRGSGSV